MILVDKTFPFKTLRARAFYFRMRIFIENIDFIFSFVIIYRLLVSIFSIIYIFFLSSYELLIYMHEIMLNNYKFLLI